MEKCVAGKIYDRRVEAKEIHDSLVFSKQLLNKLEKMTPGALFSQQHIEISGEDFCGNSIDVATGVGPALFKQLRQVLYDAVKADIKNRQKKFDEIPPAKIITVDFATKKIEPHRKPVPNPKSNYRETLQFFGGLPPGDFKKGVRRVYRGSISIIQAIGLSSYKAHRVAIYVKTKNLPAFKVEGKQPWFAFEDELMEWKYKHPEIS